MNEVQGADGVVVSPHALSTQAGLAMLEAGGNAVDAALAVNAVQGVVAPETCGIGGDLFALVWDQGYKAPQALDAAGWAGSNSSPAELRNEGLTSIPKRHPGSVTIPGCVAGWQALHDRMGTLDLGQILRPAIRLAEEGFPASNELARVTRALEGDLRQHAGGAQVLVSGRAPKRGDLVARPNLGRTLRSVAGNGASAFYEGRVAAAISEAVSGRITPDDLAGYRPDWVEPARLEVFGLTGWTIPPSSQGYLTLAALAVFETLMHGSIPPEPMWSHLAIEAYRSVAWERDDLLADRASAPQTWQQLLAKDRLAGRAAAVDPDAAGTWPSSIAGPGGTAYMCAIDGDGMAISLMQSNFSGLGTGIGAGDAGMILHNRGGGFNLIAGHPNELQPGRRPLHTLSPTLWTEAGRLHTLLGTRGGHQQPQLVSQVAANLFARGHPPGAAQSLPRWTIDDFGPGAESVISIESRASDSVIEGLERRGHRVEPVRSRMGGWGPVSIITVDEHGMKTGAADPRVDTALAAAR
jgi:gamma-glutamyltranspeptidase/glutathione hydrolase